MLTCFLPLKTAFNASSALKRVFFLDYFFFLAHRAFRAATILARPSGVIPPFFVAGDALTIAGACVFFPFHRALAAAMSLALCSGLNVRFFVTGDATGVPLIFAQRAVAAAAILALASGDIFLRPLFAGTTTAAASCSDFPLMNDASFCSSVAISSLMEMACLSCSIDKLMMLMGEGSNTMMLKSQPLLLIALAEAAVDEARLTGSGSSGIRPSLESLSNFSGSGRSAAGEQSARLRREHFLRRVFPCSRNALRVREPGGLFGRVCACFS